MFLDKVTHWDIEMMKLGKISACAYIQARRYIIRAFGTKYGEKLQDNYSYESIFANYILSFPKDVGYLDAGNINVSKKAEAMLK